MPLALSRRLNERILIGDDIWIQVVRLDSQQVRLLIEVPRHILVDREEIRIARNANSDPNNHNS